MNEIVEVACQYLKPDYVVKYERHDCPYSIDEFENLNFRKNHFTIVYIFCGEYEIRFRNIKKELSDNSFLFAKPGTDYYIKNKSGKKYEIITLRIHSSLIYKIEKQINNPVESIFKQEYLETNANEKFLLIQLLMQSFKDCIIKHYNEEEIMSRILCILSELSSYFNDNKVTDLKSDNISVNIVDYVNKHFTEKITIKDLEKKFFVSHSTIIKAFKLMTGKTFYQYLTELRLKSADSLLEKVPAAKAAELVGFATYSSFYRDYKKYYGVTPKSHTKSFINWPKL